jgi:AcrR family transcriptional regulator
VPQALWKRRAIADREEELLSIARGMLLGPGGIHGLTMERLAEATPYSKGTIYQHFNSKDDLLAALWLRPLQIRLDLYRKAATFHGSSRERILALEAARRVIFQLHPDSDKIEGSISSAALNIDPERTAEIGRIAAELMGISLGIIRDAVAQQDLALLGDLTPETIYIALRSLSFGTMHGWQSTAGLRAMLESTPITLPLELAIALLDGLGWKPLARDWDYRKTVGRIWREVFPGEAARMGLVLEAES